MITIRDRKIGRDQPHSSSREMSGNHNQSLDEPWRIVDAAAAAAPHALKLQTYTADTMTLDVEERSSISDPNSLWSGTEPAQALPAGDTPWEWHEPIMQRAHELGMICFSSPFDFSAVDFLETLNVPCYKIASFENTDLPLIRRVAATRQACHRPRRAWRVSPSWTTSCARRARPAAGSDPAQVHEHLPLDAGKHEPSHDPHMR